MKASFVVSGSLDCTVKVWDLPADLAAAEEEDIQVLTPRTTEKAHDKVNAQNSERRKFNTTGWTSRPLHSRV